MFGFRCYCCERLCDFRFFINSMHARNFLSSHQAKSIHKHLKSISKSKSNQRAWMYQMEVVRENMVAWGSNLDDLTWIPWKLSRSSTSCILQKTIFGFQYLLNLFCFLRTDRVVNLKSTSEIYHFQNIYITNCRQKPETRLHSCQINIFFILHIYS